MALRDITRAAVLAAIEEFDKLERVAFLKRYGFRPARGYFLLHKDRPYDSKAILGAAHGKLGGGQASLSAKAFSGGDKVAARILRQLGFTVITPADMPTAEIPFKRGRIYHRQRDVHQVYGGQERGGIATPNGVPFVFLFTGDSGGQYGYSDGWREDGSFAYTGEGQVGDMEFVRGNRAIRDHLNDSKDLLLFEALPSKGIYRYVDCFACAGWEYHVAPDREGNNRQTIVFNLIPALSQVGDTEDITEVEQGFATKTLSELRHLAYEAASASEANAWAAKRNYYKRSAAVKAYVLRRSAGRCESCERDAPFKKLDGMHYLEPHHTRRIADGGPDDPRWVGAVCPNCHREIHHGERGRELNIKLQQRLQAIESDATNLHIRAVDEESVPRGLASRQS